MSRKDEHEGLQDQCRFEEVDDADAWVSAAWNERRDHRTPWAELGRKHDRDWRTVRDNVRKYGKLVADAYRRGDVDALAEYLEGLHDDKDAQLSYAEEAQSVVIIGRGEDAYSEVVPDYRTRVAARKEVTAIREKIAAALEIVTKREGREQSVQPDDPLVKLLERFAPQEIAEELGNGRFAGDAGAGTGRDAAEGGSEAATGEGEA